MNHLLKFKSIKCGAHTALLLFLSFAVLPACHSQNVIPFDSPNIRYEGRIPFGTNAAELTWSGTSAAIEFKGTSISATLQDLDTGNYYNVIIDGKVVRRFHTTLAKQNFALASNLPPGKHRVELFKLTEWDKGKTLFYGFHASVSTKILRPGREKKRKIEFYGNSITCGYGLEDDKGDSGDGYFENAYLSYAAITARHFNARLSSISKSGIGIMVSWFPLIMPEMYDRLDPTDSTSMWDFSEDVPDVVVINLFQNDSWITAMPDNDQFKHRFGRTPPDEGSIVNAYKRFVVTIRSKYPHADIICALGNMDATKKGSPWPGYVKRAVEELNDPHVFTVFFPYKNTGGHPDADEQKAMADTLIDFIDKNISW
jgi:hypothetical protein